MSTELATTPSGMAIIAAAIESKADPETLRELLAVQKDWEANEARKAFSAAVSDFQKSAPIIEKADKAHNKEYARMDRIWRTIKPLLTDLGLAVTWQVTELRDSICHIEGELSHKAGHGQKIVMDVPIPSLVTGQNAAQQLGSATTYGRRYALCGALGIVTGDDDDGNMAASETVTAAQASAIRKALAAIPEAGRDDALDAMLKWAGVEQIEQIPATAYKGAMQALGRRKA